MIPFVQPIAYQSPHSYFNRVAHRPMALLLDAPAGAAEARYAYIAIEPWHTLAPVAEDPFAAIEALLDQHLMLPIPGLPPFQGGLAGYLAYEAGTHLEHLPAPKASDQPLPLAVLGCYDVVIAFDTEQRQAWCLSSGLPEDGARREQRAKARAEQILALLQQPVRIGTPAAMLSIAPTTPPAVYRQAVAECLNCIHAGDIFQANLALRFEAAWPRHASAWATYETLSAANPAPFAAYFNLGTAQILSQSPEHFLTVTGNSVTTNPIKGTLRRGGDDTTERGRLQSSAKDRAENLMIVDLLRNDLARVCRPGSVRVPALWQVVTHPYVHHLVSTVTGQLAADANLTCVLRSCFPGGSITGAPKIRAQEIIQELEPIPRGVYCGSMGYIGFDGSLQLNIAIRTAVVSHGKITWHSGCGIVADSDPQAEYQEALAKAASFLHVLGQQAHAGVA